MATTTTLLRSGVAFMNTLTAPLPAGRKRVSRWVRSAGLARRMRFSAVISATMLPGRSQSQARTWYFSLSRYSSLPGTGAPSHSSKPLYTPHSPDSVAASAARIR